MTEEQLRLIAIARCPFCGSAEIEGEDYAFDGDKAWREIFCERCLGMWKIIYKVESLTIIEEPGLDNHAVV